MNAPTNQIRVPWPENVPFPAFDEEVAFGDHHYGLLIETLIIAPPVEGEFVPAREAVFIIFSRTPIGD